MMKDWTAGYVADIGYTFGYYPELNPLRIQMAFLEAGLVFPQVGVACELGFGQGVSINAHAAASITHWVGTDFNPSQASFAQEFAKASGAKVDLYDEAFAEFCQRSDMPDFDYISLHGIWSWISDENRHIIVDFIRRKLKVGGVLYISYNIQAGWTSTIPLRDLLTQHAEVMSAPAQALSARIDSSFAFMDQLMATSPSFARANPILEKRLNDMKGMSKSYLAHEYFNRDWEPMPFSKIANWLAPAKLDYACPAYFLDQVDAVNLTDDQQALLQQIPDTVFRESVRDFCLNRNFRRDYWVKGIRQLTPAQQVAEIRMQEVMMVKAVSPIDLKVKGYVGEVNLKESIYQPIIAELQSCKIKTIGEIEKAVIQQGITLAQVRQAIIILAGMGLVYAVQNKELINQAKVTSNKMNQQSMKNAFYGIEASYLVSPVIGGCIAVSRIELLCLLAKSQGKNTTREWIDYVWEILSMRGQKLMKNGVALETEAENLEELSLLVKSVEDQLPIYTALGVI